MSLERLLRQMTILAKTNRAELAMVNDMRVITTDRIFTNGLDANGSSIGDLFRRLYEIAEEGKLWRLYKSHIARLRWQTQRIKK
jgi:hypothetical protein